MVECANCKVLVECCFHIQQENVGRRWFVNTRGGRLKKNFIQKFWFLISNGDFWSLFGKFRSKTKNRFLANFVQNIIFSSLEIQKFRFRYQCHKCVFNNCGCFACVDSSNMVVLVVQRILCWPWFLCSCIRSFWSILYTCCTCFPYRFERMRTRKRILDDFEKYPIHLRRFRQIPETSLPCACCRICWRKIWRTKFSGS